MIVAEGIPVISNRSELRLKKSRKGVADEHSID